MQSKYLSVPPRYAPGWIQYVYVSNVYRAQLSSIYINVQSCGEAPCWPATPTTDHSRAGNSRPRTFGSASFSQDSHCAQPVPELLGTGCAQVFNLRPFLISRA